MKNVDYVYILLLTIIAALLLMLVMKPDPQPVKPRVYSEVVCDGHKVGVELLGMSPLALDPKSAKGLKAKSKVENLIVSRLKDGWEVLHIQGVLCYAR